MMQRFEAALLALLATSSIAVAGGGGGPKAESATKSENSAVLSGLAGGNPQDGGARLVTEPGRRGASHVRRGAAPHDGAPQVWSSAVP